jgi:hypothetical protein
MTVEAPRLGLLDVLGYLAPGVVLLSSVLLMYFEEYFARLVTSSTLSIGFVLAGYIAGHFLSVLSYPLVWVRDVVKWISYTDPREERYPFYLDLRQHLRGAYGGDLERDDEYPFSRQTAVQHSPVAKEEVERLAGLTMFCRNSTMAFLALAGAVFQFKPLPASFVLIGAVLLFVRYVQFERELEATVLRLAHMHFAQDANDAD